MDSDVVMFYNEVQRILIYGQVLKNQPLSKELRTDKERLHVRETLQDVISSWKTPFQLHT
jgi:hypothetical protein